MEKMWAGRITAAGAEVADDFNSSIRFDSRMYRQDITGSMAHVQMLARQGIISVSDAQQIHAGLADILLELDNGTLEFDRTAEDIHMFVEAELTKRLPDAGKKLHTARSRNDQVALDLRLYLKDEVKTTTALIRELLTSLVDQAQEHADTIMPGYTHLQRAQPITFGHHLLAYGMMLRRDLERLADAVKRMDYSPLGACALAGTTYPIDRQWTATELGMSGIMRNSLDAVSDRDYCVELLSALSILMMHLSRLCEEIVLWTSWEFRFVELDDAFATGSSIMPQKKNSDMAELVRGKTGRVYGDLIGTLTMLKGLPLAYNKDMQEDKESIFDAFETVECCLRVFAPMIKTMRVKQDNMLSAAKGGFINATDLADYLTKRGMSFRAAYRITGTIVAHCIENGMTLDTLPLAEYQHFSNLFASDLFDEISLKTCVEKRTSAGGTGAESVRQQIAYLRKVLEETK